MKLRNPLGRVVGIATLLGWLGEQTLSAQCAMCRTVLTSPDAHRIAAALRAGIGVLLAAPIGAFAVIAVAAVRRQRRFDAERESERS